MGGPGSGRKPGGGKGKASGVKQKRYTFSIKNGHIVSKKYNPKPPVKVRADWYKVTGSRSIGPKGD